MLRPERMSKVSVTGAKRVMDDAIETIHGLNLVHVVDYDDRWEGFRPGDPAPEAEGISEKLVTVRSIESILDIDEEDAGPSRIVTDEEIDAEIEEVRARVNELDDRRVELREERRDIDDRLSSVRPFATLGIDLDLLSGYDSLETRVVEGREAEIRDALSAADGINSFETFAEDGVVAVFAHPESGHEDVLDDALVGVEVTPLSVPEAEASPEEYVADLEHRRQQIDSKLATIDGEIEELKLDVAGFLLAVEEQLSIDVEKAEVPLSFATTDRSFIAEGWVPTKRYDELETALDAEVGEHVECEELERVDYDDVAHGHGHGSHDDEPGDAGDAERQPATAATDGDGQAAEVRSDGGEPSDARQSPSKARSDGGHASATSMHGDEPPVVQENPKTARPFQLLVEAINRPRYFELDPTIVLFLTFPVMFGLMIGDVGYGILYMAMGYGLYRAVDSPALKSLGGIALWCGIFTTVFGVLYGEFLGFHVVSTVLWEGIVGLEHAPIEKGLDSAFALFWLVVALLIGLVHLTVGYVFGFVNELETDGLVPAAASNLSWAFLAVGLWVWIFSTSYASYKPEFLFTVFDGEPMALGFGGFSPAVGTVGLVVAAAGLAGAVYGEYLHEGGVGIIIGVLESLTNGLAHVISYTRITAVLLAKAGMAFVVNLLVVGAYEDESGHFHFMTGSHAEVPEGGELMFGGIVTTDAGLAVAAATVLAGALVFVVGHLVVLGLGITSAGLQGVRLEYVEFFGKFYDGGGENYEPFGTDRTHTTE
ncbi:V-type ATP synthase subunit I [Halalkalicoccus sp. NIPERK01]|uniref:V-type ATP synthase subunit I n=1 Tax=Halalkalicoccus sp. NIPERK01 TaxID=3053469 RepID=UPI00256F54C3|nr:V-type ATP synthase subunit I [Halalkalicoccus sp. NIPERK01]MDL5363556.1 V-type ATP synthase subunit I [Halalkalicoccus sp. NIPERK01]